jgi:hypothetical protein
MEPRLIYVLRLRRPETMPNVLSNVNEEDNSVVASLQQRCNEVVMLYRVRPGSEGKNDSNQN